MRSFGRRDAEVVSRFKRSFLDSDKAVQNNFHTLLKTLCLIVHHHDPKAVQILNNRDPVFWKDKCLELEKEESQSTLCWLLEAFGGPKLEPSLVNSLSTGLNILLEELAAAPTEKDLKSIDPDKLRRALGAKDWLYWTFILGPLLPIKTLLPHPKLEDHRTRFISFYASLCRSNPSLRKQQYRTPLLLVWSVRTELAHIFQTLLTMEDRDVLEREATRSIRYGNDPLILTLNLATALWIHKHSYSENFRVPATLRLRQFDAFVKDKHSIPLHNLEVMAISFLRVVSEWLQEVAPLAKSLLTSLLPSQKVSDLELSIPDRYWKLILIEKRYHGNSMEILTAEMKDSKHDREDDDDDVFNGVVTLPPTKTTITRDKHYTSIPSNMTGGTDRTVIESHMSYSSPADPSCELSIFDLREERGIWRACQWWFCLH